MSERAPTVLVVDDDPAVRAIVARGLLLGSYDVLQADDGISALMVLQVDDHAPVSLVITDIVMPGLRGDDLGRLLRQSHPALPVLYMSAFSAPELNFLMPDELGRCWLTKPFTMQELLEKVRKLLKGQGGLVGALGPAS
jgi:two-component system, cell cycle sensor histidine kinase and response regulator CckA